MYSLLRNQNVISSLSPIALLSLVITMTAGTVLAVWLGELITEYGFKNGVSILIFSGIVARLPVVFGQSATVFQSQDILKVIIFLVLAIVVVGLVIFVSESARQIPIHYAKRRLQSGLTESSYLPLRLNQAGVIPIIFAVSLVLLPSLLGQFLAGVNNPAVAGIARGLTTFFNPQSATYNIFYFLLVFGFTYFYTAVVFNPEKIAENLQKGGGFIPGISRKRNRKISFICSLASQSWEDFGIHCRSTIIFQNFVGASNLAIGEPQF